MEHLRLLLLVEHTNRNLALHALAADAIADLIRTIAESVPCPTTEQKAAVGAALLVRGGLLEQMDIMQCVEAAEEMLK